MAGCNPEYAGSNPVLDSFMFTVGFSLGTISEKDGNLARNKGFLLWMSRVAAIPEDCKSSTLVGKHRKFESCLIHCFVITGMG